MLYSFLKKLTCKGANNSLKTENSNRYILCDIKERNNNYFYLFLHVLIMNLDFVFANKQ